MEIPLKIDSKKSAKFWMNTYRKEISMNNTIIESYISRNRVLEKTIKELNKLYEIHIRTI